MSSFYYTDTIALTNLIQDATYGSKTVASERIIKCRVENHNKLITNHQGQDIRTHTFIMMSPNEVIRVGDRFKIITKNGIAYREASKEFQVKVIFDNAGFLQGNLEVYA